MPTTDDTLEIPTTELVDFLLRPETHGSSSVEVQHFETPISHVFVAPPFAYKLKKPVDLSFLSFRTREQRLAACKDEIRLNQRLCRPLYLGIRTVSRTPTGDLELGRGAERAEPLVWMRALPAHGMLPAALAEGRILPEHLRRFGRALADFHAAAPSDPPATAPSTLERVESRWNEVLENCRSFPTTLFRPADRHVLFSFGQDFVARHARLLSGRARAGRIRETHGDLHSANLCLVDEPLPPIGPAPEVPPGLYAFDCIEFSEALRWNDVASEVAFLFMDLELRDRADLAEAFLTSYESHVGDPDLRILLPYYEVHRATVRGMVHGQTSCDASRADDEREEAAQRARGFFRAAAVRAWGASGPLLVACSGLSGSGKTTLAARLSERMGFAHVSSDEIRKRRAGIDPQAAADRKELPNLYSDEARDRVYRDVREQAGEPLRSGRGVLTDATYTRRRERDALREAAAAAGAPCLFLECHADPQTIRARLESRAAAPVDPTHLARSDADWAVYERQLATAEPLADDEPHLRIDTGAAPLDDLVESAVTRLWDRALQARLPRST